jgi:hypothetical protein
MRRVSGALDLMDGSKADGQTWRSTSFILSSAMASAGFNPFGHALAQFMMVWQR